MAIGYYEVSTDVSNGGYLPDEVSTFDVVDAVAEVEYQPDTTLSSDPAYGYIYWPSETLGGGDLVYQMNAVGAAASNTHVFSLKVWLYGQYLGYYDDSTGVGDVRVSISVDGGTSWLASQQVPQGSMGWKSVTFSGAWGSLSSVRLKISHRDDQSESSFSGVVVDQTYRVYVECDYLTLPGTAATSFSLVGPGTAVVGMSYTYVMELNGTNAGVTVTPSASGGGSFSPTSVVLSTSSPRGSFTYTPSSGGSKTLSTGNSGSLSDPSPLTVLALVSRGGVVSGLRAWWLASQVSGADSDPVSSMPNIAATSVTAATQSDASKKPVLLTTGFNGKPCLSFDGANDELFFSGLDLSGQSFTVVVVQQSDAPRGSFFGLGSETVTDKAMHLGWGAAGTDLALRLYSDDHSFPVVLTNTARRVITFRFDAAGEGTSVGEVFQDLTSLGTHSTFNPFTGNTLGSIGDHRFSSDAFPGKIPEVIVFGRRLGDEEVENVVNDLLAEYEGVLPPGVFNPRNSSTFLVFF